MAGTRRIGLWQVGGWAVAALLWVIAADLPPPTRQGDVLGSLAWKAWALLGVLVALLLAQLAWAVFFRRGRHHQSLDQVMSRVAPRPPPASRHSAVAKPIVAPSAAAPVQALSYGGARGEDASLAISAASPRSIWWRATMTVLYLPCASMTWFVWKLIRGPYVVVPLHRQFPQYDEPIAFGLAALSTLLFFLLLVPFVSIWRLGRS